MTVIEHARAAKERPILFSTPMVQALLDGRKTQTRRVCKLDLPSGVKPSQVKLDFCPYGVPGDLLWVREAWMLPSLPCTDERIVSIDYRACLDPETQGCDRLFLEGVSDATLQDAQRIWDADVRLARTGWRPGIHMPRWAARLLLEIVDIRAEQVQGISEKDACAEGVGNPVTRDLKRPKFATLWDQINEPRGYGWRANPWVWVVEFKVVRS